MDMMKRNLTDAAGWLKLPRQTCYYVPFSHNVVYCVSKNDGQKSTPEHRKMLYILGKGRNTKVTSTVVKLPINNDDQLEFGPNRYWSNTFYAADRWN